MSRQEARKLLGEAPLSFSLSLDTDYEARLAEAQALGATHITLGAIPLTYDALMPDNHDPYPNWSQGKFSLFRVFPPPGVEQHLPEGLPQRFLDWLDERVAVMRKLGLRMVVHGLEPLWLPEAVFAERPHWRGVQCELGRIARKPYWCPSIDEPEVRAAYRESTRQLCERYPEIDRLSFWTNDCGAGLPWSTYSYPGLNGPTQYRQRDPGDRIVGWLQAIRQGSLDAGTDVRVSVNSFSFPPAEQAAIRAQLGDDLYLNSTNGNGARITAGGANSGGGVVGTSTNPVLGHFDRPGFVEGLQKVFDRSDHRMRSVSLGASTEDEAKMLLRAFLANPGQGVLHQHQVLLTVARELAGDEHGDLLFKAWARVEQANHCLKQLRQRGLSLSLSFGLTGSRWLVRPLVPEPLKLTDEETAHYRGMLFNCDSPEEAADLCTILGKPVFIGDSVVWMARWGIDEAQKHLATARGLLDQIPAEARPAHRERRALYAAQIEALRLVAECGRLAIMYQHALNIAHVPRFAANPLDFDDNIQFDQRALELRKIARMDLDNTQALCDLLRQFGPNEVIAQAPTAEEESVFRYGPNLIELLQRKREIMLAHWQDYERLYPTSKRYEFEPAPREPFDVSRPASDGTELP